MNEHSSGRSRQNEKSEKPQKQFLNELKELRQSVREMVKPEELDAERKRVEEA